MSKIIQKTSAVCGLYTYLVLRIIDLLPLSSELIYISYILGALTFFTMLLCFTAVFKHSVALANTSWIWVTFFAPLLTGQVIFLAILGQYVPVEILRVWGLPISFAIVPFLVSGAALYLQKVMMNLEY